MKSAMRRIVCLVGIASSFILHPSSFASDWRQFRGPNGSGYAPDATIPSRPGIQWSVALPGRGLSSPIIVGGKVFVSCSSGPKQERLHVFCFSAADGAKIWERQMKATGRTMAHPKTSVASSSPCSDGRRVFVQWSCNDLAAFDLDGNLLWLRGLTVDYANASNSIGMASSPLVAGESLVVQIENDSESYALGIDANTGRNLWRMDRPKAANWTSAIVWDSGPKTTPVAVLQSSKGLTGVDPQTGSRLWEYTDGAGTMASSVAAKGAIYAVSHGVTALQPQANGAEPKQLWRSEQINPGTASPVVVGDRLFAINSAGVLNALDLKTQDRGWRPRLAGPFSASLVAGGDRILAVNEKGLVQIVDTKAPQDSAVVGTLQLPLNEGSKELLLSTPSLSGGHVFIRSDSKLWRLGE
jgi:outer membrane protein assembly factor BamB